jgi:hypothetical protein
MKARRNKTFRSSAWVVAICFIIIPPLIAQRVEGDDQVAADGRAAAYDDVEVRARVNEYLNYAFKQKGDLALSTRLWMAFNKSSEDRNMPGHSTDIAKRNAEYYILGLAVGAEGKIEDCAKIAGVPIYESVKYAALKLEAQGFEWAGKLFRSNPNNPVSEPGGTRWAYGGLRDGYPLNGIKIVPASTGGHGLTLAYLDSDSAGKQRLQTETHNQQRTRIDTATSSNQIIRKRLAEQERENEIYRQWERVNEDRREAQREGGRTLRIPEPSPPAGPMSIPDFPWPQPDAPSSSPSPQIVTPHPPVPINPNR